MKPKQIITNAGVVCLIGIFQVQQAIAQKSIQEPAPVVTKTAIPKVEAPAPPAGTVEVPKLTTPAPAAGTVEAPKTTTPAPVMETVEAPRVTAPAPVMGTAEVPKTPDIAPAVSTTETMAPTVAVPTTVTTKTATPQTSAPVAKTPTMAPAASTPTAKAPTVAVQATVTTKTATPTAPTPAAKAPTAASAIATPATKAPQPVAPKTTTSAPGAGTVEMPKAVAPVEQEAQKTGTPEVTISKSAVPDVQLSTTPPATISKGEVPQVSAPVVPEAQKTATPEVVMPKGSSAPDVQKPAIASKAAVNAPVHGSATTVMNTPSQKAESTGKVIQSDWNQSRSKFIELQNQVQVTPQTRKVTIKVTRKLDEIDGLMQEFTQLQIDPQKNKSALADASVALQGYEKELDGLQRDVKQQLESCKLQMELQSGSGNDLPKSDPSLHQKLQDEMDKLNEMYDVLSSIMKSMHKMQMQAVKNIL